MNPDTSETLPRPSCVKKVCSSAVPTRVFSPESDRVRDGIHASFNAEQTAAADTAYLAGSKRVEFTGIFHQDLAQQGWVLVSHRPDPVVGDVAVIGHFVGRGLPNVAAAGNDH